MSRRTNILVSLRRRRASLGRFLCLVFAMASLSVGAAPCFAMAAPAGPDSRHDSHAQASSHTSGNHEHSHAVSHDRHAGAADHAMSMEGSSGVPGACPHCPLSVGMSSEASTGAHAFCSAGDDVADSGNSGAFPLLFKHAVSSAVIQVDLALSRPSRACNNQRPLDVSSSAVALNLRHCVFLI